MAGDKVVFGAGLASTVPEHLPYEIVIVGRLVGEPFAAAVDYDHPRLGPVAKVGS